MWSQGLNICTSSSSMWRGIRWIVTAFPIKNKKSLRPQRMQPRLGLWPRVRVSDPRSLTQRTNWGISVEGQEMLLSEGKSGRIDWSCGDTPVEQASCPMQASTLPHHHAATEGILYHGLRPRVMPITLTCRLMCNASRQGTRGQNIYCYQV